MASAEEFDLFVIGGGSGGVRAARIAAGYGAKVLVAEVVAVNATNATEQLTPAGTPPEMSAVIDDSAIEEASGLVGFTSPCPPR